MSSDEWRWSDEQGVQRLVRLEELRQALATRVLPASTPVWRQGMAEWLPAERVAELQSALAGPANGEKKGEPRRTLLGVQAVKGVAPKPTTPLPRFSIEQREPTSKSVASPAPRPREGLPALPRPAPSRPAPAVPLAPQRAAAAAVQPVVAAPTQTPAEETSTLVLPDQAPEEAVEVSAVLDAREMIAASATPPVVTTQPFPAALVIAAPVTEPIEAPAEMPSFPRPPALPQESTVVMAMPSVPPRAEWLAPGSTGGALPSGPSHPPHAGHPSQQPQAQAHPSQLPPGAGAYPSQMPPQMHPSQLPPGLTPSRLPPSMMPGRIEDPVLVPLLSLAGVGGFIVLSLVVAFFVGRLSAGDEGRVDARAGLGPVIAKVREALPRAPKACWVVRQPVRWAEEASKSTPFELSPTPQGTLAMGYARDSERAVGLEVVPTTGEVAERFTRTMRGASIDRVSPLPGEPLDFFVSTVQGAELARSYVSVPERPAFLVSVDTSGVGVTEAIEVEPTNLWAFEGTGEATAMRIQRAGDGAHLVTLRRGGAILGGLVGADRKPRGPLAKIEGSGGAVGKPVPAWNGRELAVVFADQPTDSAWQIRVAHGPPAAVPTATTVLALPPGGPGGDAFAPGIVGLEDGRWLLIWTEGKPGSRAVRAQTLARDFTGVGDPIALSPPAGSFGQGVLGVASPYVAAVFLSKGEVSFELWGAMLRCE